MIIVMTFPVITPIMYITAPLLTLLILLFVMTVKFVFEVFSPDNNTWLFSHDLDMSLKLIIEVFIVIFNSKRSST